jgi:hypothetical protein
MKFGQPEYLSLDQLLLDPNNYRFLDMKEYVRAEPTRYHEETVQKNSYSLIQREGQDELRALKESIQTNGYVPLETLVVRPYLYKSDSYVVVEGNRRVAAMRWLMQDKAAGAAIEQSLADNFNKIPAIVIDPNSPDYDNLQHIMMGLRHVSGIKQWGGYQRARLIVELVDDQGTPISEAAKSISMSSHEATRRYRAFKALEQMRQDEEFGQYYTPKMYRLFHEAVAQPKVRQWLAWDEESLRFTNEDHLYEFYRLLVPYKPDDDEEEDKEPGDARKPKIQTYEDVRNLKEILGDADAEESLLDPKQSFADALALAKAATTIKLMPRLKAAHQALDKLPVDVLKKLPQKDIKHMQDLYGALKERLADWTKLTGKKMKL